MKQGNVTDQFSWMVFWYGRVAASCFLPACPELVDGLQAKFPPQKERYWPQIGLIFENFSNYIIYLFCFDLNSTQFEPLLRAG